jgi:hypothetical protein
VKTLGRRSAKPTATEKLWKNTSNITERHQLRTKQEKSTSAGEGAEMEM